MPVKRAKNHFLGKEGCKRMNCAQAVVYAFQDKFHLDGKTVEEFRMYGSGRAPGGLCGAFYATKYLLEKGFAEKAKDFEDHFLQQSGALKCHDIRSLKKLTCVKCVEKSAEFLEDIVE